MITLNQYIEELLKLQKTGYGELCLVFSSDSEGNSYHHVENIPNLFQVENIEEEIFDLKCNIDYDEKGKLINFKPNCIIIN